MNILIFNWRDIRHSWAGGSELYIHELAKRWVKKGNKVIFFSAQDIYKKLPQIEVIDGVEIHRKGGRFSVYFWAPLYYFRHLRKNTDIIVDVENGIPFFTPLFAAKKIVTLVYHVHNVQFFYELTFPYNVVGFLLEKYIFPFLYRSTSVMAISQSTKNELIKLGFKKSSISIVHPGIDLPSDVKKEKQKYKKPTVVYLGRIKKYKRLDLLIKIFHNVLQQNPKARLLIAGWGTEAPQIIDMVMKNGYRRNVILVGPVSEREKRVLLEKSWVMVNPSLHEGWGISVLEANAHGTPAVSFKVPGLSDAIRDKKTGLLSNTEDDFVTNISLLLNDDRVRNQLEKQAKKWAATFSWDLAAKKSLSILKNTL